MFRPPTGNKYSNMLLAFRLMHDRMNGGFFWSRDFTKTHYNTNPA